MKLEAGKKYKGRYSGAIYTCLYSDDSVSLVRNETTQMCTIPTSTFSVVEYVEPPKIYTCVHRQNNGRLCAASFISETQREQYKRTVSGSGFNMTFVEEFTNTLKKA